MSPDTLAKRIFFCILIVILVYGATGCHSTKYEWLPEDKPPLHIHEKETGVIKGTIVKLSF